MKIVAALHRLAPRKSLTLSACMLATSLLLLWLHVQAVRNMRDVGLPAALTLPALEKRQEVLHEQQEIMELQAALRGGSVEEILRTYVLPENDEADRLLALFDVLFSYMEQRRMLTAFSSVDIGERTTVNDDLFALPVSFEVTVTPEGRDLLLDVIDMAGLLTVSDALSRDAIDAMLRMTEEENPASIAALEHFLTTDLLRYAEQPKPYEDELRTSFSPAAEQALDALFQSPRLRQARDVYGTLAPVLRQQHLWPLRMLTVEQLSSQLLADKRLRLTLTLHAYVRGR